MHAYARRTLSTQDSDGRATLKPHLMTVIADDIFSGSAGLSPGETTEELSSHLRTLCTPAAERILAFWVSDSLDSAEQAPPTKRSYYYFFLLFFLKHLWHRVFQRNSGVRIERELNKPMLQLARWLAHMQ